MAAECVNKLRSQGDAAITAELLDDVTKMPELRQCRSAVGLPGRICVSRIWLGLWTNPNSGDSTLAILYFRSGHTRNAISLVGQFTSLRRMLF